MSIIFRLFFSLSMIALFSGSSIYAQSGTLDSSFGAAGVVTLPSGKVARNVAELSDGKLLASNTDFTVSRYNADGSLDTAFGVEGTSADPSLGSVLSGPLAVQADGKILVGGFSNDAPQHSLVVRYNTDGSIDTTFGMSGVVDLNLDPEGSSVAGIVVQGDGKIVLVSQGGSRGVVFLTVRLNDDGSLDTSFGTNGSVETGFGDGPNFPIAGFVQDDGKIIIAGGNRNANVFLSDVMIVRYNADGTLDTGFGTNGIVIYGDVDRAETTLAGLLQDDGKIVIAGYDRLGFEDNNILLVRFNSDGSVDTNFGTNGRVQQVVSGGIFATSVVGLPQGEYVVSGQGQNGGGLVVARYSDTGELNQDFATADYATFGTVLGEIHGTLLNSGKLFVGTFNPETDKGLLALVNVAIVDLPETSYASWLSEYFTIEEVADSAITGENADPDRDGDSNFFEFMAVLDPTDGQSRLSVQVDGLNTELLFVSPVNVGATFSIERSSDLADWEEVAVVEFAAEERLELEVAVGTQTTREAFYRAVPNRELVPEGLAVIPAGTFTIGSPVGESVNRWDDEAQREVTFTQSFYMDKTETTWTEWTSVRDWAIANGYANMTAGQRGHTDTSAVITDEHPVVEVNWYDVLMWCNARSEMEGLTPVYYSNSAMSTVFRSGEGGNIHPDWAANGYRLPTEAEWEYSCRAGTTTAFYSGDLTFEGSTPLDPNLDAVAWYEGNSDQSTHPVGLKTPNAWGLYDMHGNVCEWTWNHHDAMYPASPLTDPKGPANGGTRIYRSSCWTDASSNSRAAYRGEGDAVQSKNSCIGFRVVRLVAQ